MFKRKSKPSQVDVGAAKAAEERKITAQKHVPEDPIEREINATVKRANRLKSLIEEQQMWGEFAKGCKAGRNVFEDYRMIFGLEEAPARLSFRMDEDSALMVRDFALRMAADRERRLKDMLNA